MSPDTLKQLAVALSLAALMVGTQAFAAAPGPAQENAQKKAAEHHQDTNRATDVTPAGLH